MARDCQGASTEETPPTPGDTSVTSDGDLRSSELYSTTGLWSIPRLVNNLRLPFVVVPVVPVVSVLSPVSPVMDWLVAKCPSDCLPTYLLSVRMLDPLGWVIGHCSERLLDRGWFSGADLCASGL